jgi:hypothetical protein
MLRTEKDDVEAQKVLKRAMTVVKQAKDKLM